MQKITCIDTGVEKKMDEGRENTSVCDLRTLLCMGACVGRVIVALIHRNMLGVIGSVMSCQQG